MKPFCSVTEDDIARAKRLIDRVEYVIDCGCPIGEFNRANEALLRYAGNKVRKDLPL